MKLVITQIDPPLGSGPGEVRARNDNNQVVKFTVHATDWKLFEACGAVVGDTVRYNPASRIWEHL